MEETKDPQLVDKVNNLCELLEAETNPIKKGIYSAQLDFLISRMEKEIDIQTIKEEYIQKRLELKEAYDSKIPTITSSKEKALNDIDKYSREMKRYSRYDPKSPKFAFKFELENAQGNLTEFQMDLIAQDKVDLADRIDKAVLSRENYEHAVSELEQLEEKGYTLQEDLMSEQEQNKKEETSLITQRHKKGNIFTRIFNAIKRGFKVAKGEPYAESTEVSEFDKKIDEQNARFEEDLHSISEKLNDELKKAEQTYNEQIRACEEQFEQQKSFLEKLYGEQTEIAKSHHEPIIEGFTKARRAKFIESLGVNNTVENWQKIHGSDDDNLKDSVNVAKDETPLVTPEDALKNEPSAVTPDDVLEDEKESSDFDNSSDGKETGQIDYSFFPDRDD